MTPDERDRWRLDRVEQSTDRLDERLRGLTVEVAVNGRALEDHAAELREQRADMQRVTAELWADVGGLRRLFVGAIVTIATGAVGTALAVALGVIGGGH